MTDTWFFSTDGGEFLLWRRFDADLCHGHDDAYGVHAAAVVVGRCAEQSLSKHLFMRWRYRWSAGDCGNWQWLAVYDFGHLGVFQCRRDLGHETIRAHVAREDGP